MESYLTFAIVLLLTVAATQADTNGTACDSGYWGDGCVNICGDCYVPQKETGGPKCDTVDGSCSYGCSGGYKGEKCDTAICDGGCGTGTCLAPGYCGNCGNINKVSPNCEDIRIRGLMGSVGSFLIIFSSITLCGLGARRYKKRRNAPASFEKN